MRIVTSFFFTFLFFSSFLNAQVWPGDVNNNGVVNEADLLYLGFGYGETGPTRKTVSAAWESQFVSTLWATSLQEGLDLSFADCNGDGVIDDLDVQAIKDNFGRTHNDVNFQPEEIPAGILGQSAGFSIKNKDLVITPETKTIEIELELGDSLIGVDNLIGLSFYIKTNSKAFDIQSTDFQFKGWLPEENANVLTRVASGGRSAPGDFIVAYSKTNKTASSGKGPIGVITLTPSFVVEADLPDFKITIDSIILLDENFDKIPVLGTEFTIETTGFIDSTTMAKTICQGETYAFNGTNLITSGTYWDTLTNDLGLDSFLILNLSVLDTAQTVLNKTICAGENYAFNEQILNTTGSYRDTLIAVNGCNQYVTLNLSVLDTSKTVLSKTICAGENFIFNNQELSTSGIYRDTLVAINGCNQYVTMNLSVLDTAQTVLNKTICAGKNYAFNNQMLSTTGIYRDTLVAANGCNQFIVLNLEVADILQTVLERNICAGQSMLFNGNNLTTSGTYRDTLEAANGCDSTVVLNLNVSALQTTQLNESICEGSSRFFNEKNLIVSGIYLDTMAGFNGCDSFIMLNLTVSNVVNIELNKTICEGSSWFFNEQLLTIAGTYQDSFTTANGCDSLITLNLKIATSVETQVENKICQGESFQFNGQVMTTAGVYLDTLSTSYGCDSFIQMNLTILDAFETVLDTLICQGDILNFHGFVLDSENTYRVTLGSASGCDSVVVLNLAVGDLVQTVIDSSICPGESMLFNNHNLSLSGTYMDTLTNINGCDSFLMLKLTALQSCQSVGIENQYIENIQVFPNPATDRLFIYSPDIPITAIELVNSTGQKILTRSFTSPLNPSDRQEINLQTFAPRMYWVIIHTEYGLKQELIAKF